MSMIAKRLVDAKMENFSFETMSEEDQLKHLDDLKDLIKNYNLVKKNGS